MHKNYLFNLKNDKYWAAYGDSQALYAYMWYKKTSAFTNNLTPIYTTKIHLKHDVDFQAANHPGQVCHIRPVPLAVCYAAHDQHWIQCDCNCFVCNFNLVDQFRIWFEKKLICFYFMQIRFNLLGSDPTASVELFKNLLENSSSVCEFLLAL